MTNVYTMRRERVVERFKPGETHFQLPKDTVPEDEG